MSRRTLGTAKAYPKKSFFVRMITRDIALEDCILDLIDNSVDGAWKCEGSRPVGLAEHADLSAYKIEIEASSDRFLIRDNCGGMSLNDAVDYAFSFGPDTEERHSDYSIGVYGIGMKRAVFKLGTKIEVRSTYRPEGEEPTSFVVPIDVPNWLKNDGAPWDFDIEEAPPLDRAGVEIVVSTLADETSESFDSPAFLQNLRRIIGRDYSLHLNRGLNIEVNGVPVKGWKLDFRQSEEFSPVRLEYEDEVGEATVSVEIIGGMASPPPESNDPDESEDGDQRYGWYVVCNGRIVLAADKTTVSGWGTEDWPQWHRQYSGFIGIVLFTSPKAAALPLTTTKRSVDQSANVYRRARPRMREVSKAWIRYTNQRKQAIEEAKEREEKATAVSLYSVRAEPALKVPTFTERPKERVANVHYSVPLVRMKKLQLEIGGGATFRDVGLKSFDYFYTDMVGED